MSEYFLGTMGFGYQDWVGVFYPEKFRSQNFLSYYSRKFNSVELDTTFYGVPRTSKVAQWAASVPDNFKFCAKLPRQITHEKGLREAQAELDEFVDAMKGLGDKLGVLLIQLPPSFTFAELESLREFLALLPKEVRFAVEFRHASWLQPQTEELLKLHQICWATTEFPGLPNEVKRTCDFLYIRWIGQHGTYDRHSHERVDKTSSLIWWKDQIQPHLDHVSEVYGFFNNDYAGYAVGTCNKFKEILGMPGKTDEMTQGRLF